MLTITPLMDPMSTKVFRVPADDNPVMPNLYFCQPHAQNQGMLRAVISHADCQALVRPDSATYVGDDFPKVFDQNGHKGDFAVLGFSADEEVRIVNLG